MILDFLEGRCELDALSDAEKCAICAAMEDKWPLMQPPGLPYPNTVWTAQSKTHSLRYEIDGTAALRLVERFKLRLSPPPDDDDFAWCVDCYLPGMWELKEFDNNPSTAIVSAVCRLAREQWPYKEIAGSPLGRGVLI